MDGLAANSSSSSNPVPIVLNLAAGTYSDTVVNAPAGVKVTINGGGGAVVVGNSPAFELDSGDVLVENLIFTTATNAPTILVTGGSLTLRNTTVQTSTAYVQSAILITGGSVDLGTASSPGGNTFNVNGTGTLIENTTGSPVPAVGDTFENNGAAAASGFGIVALTAPSAQTANQGVPQPVSLGSLTDTDNDSQSWAVDVNWGDGSAHTDFNAASTGPLSAQSHAFALPGTYTVTVTATDPIASGATAWDLVQTFTVTVAPSVLILDPTAGGALSLSGNASLKIPGAIVVDSSSSAPCRPAATLRSGPRSSRCTARSRRAATPASAPRRRPAPRRWPIRSAACRSRAPAD